MTQQEFLGIVAEKIQSSVEKASEVLEVILSILSEEIVENGAVYIDGFGAFKTQKKPEYVSLNSITGERLLMPPSIEIVFEPFLNESIDAELEDDDTAKTDTAYTKTDTAYTKTDTANTTTDAANTTTYTSTDNTNENNYNIVNRYYNSKALFFEPDVSLRNSINSAFINFEPTVVNEGVVFSGLEVISDAQLSSDVSVYHEPTVESVSQFTIAEQIASQEDVKTHHTIQEFPPVIGAVPPVIDASSPAFDAAPPVIDATSPVFDAAPPVKQRSNNNRIWMPIMGCVAITLAALFFFNGTAKKEGK